MIHWVWNSSPSLFSPYDEKRMTEVEMESKEERSSKRSWNMKREKKRQRIEKRAEKRASAEGSGTKQREKSEGEERSKRWAGVTLMKRMKERGWRQQRSEQERTYSRDSKHVLSSLILLLDSSCVTWTGITEGKRSPVIEKREDDKKVPSLHSPSSPLQGIDQRIHTPSFLQTRKIKQRMEMQVLFCRASLNKTKEEAFSNESHVRDRQTRSRGNLTRAKFT